MRIWLNHWFSTAYRLIENAKRDFIEIFPNKRVEFIGTNAKEDCVYKLMCNEFYVEPEGLNEEQYIGWCLGFCTTHKGFQIVKSDAKEQNQNKNKINDLIDCVDDDITENRTDNFILAENLPKGNRKIEVNLLIIDYLITIEK